MAIRLIGTAYGTNTATMPAHQTGDLIVVFAFRDGSTTAPTLVTSPSYTSIANAGANTCSYRIARRIATSSGETVGTWTNATSVIVHVYRGVDQTTPIGVDGTSTGASTTVTYPALTLGVTDGSSWVAGFAGHRSVNTTLETPPTGMVLREHTVDATDEAAGHDTAGGVASWSSTNVSVGGTSSGWCSAVIEIRADTTDTSQYQRIRTAATRDSITNLPGIPYWEEFGPLYFISNGTGQTTALRFTGLNIPQGATIVDARITLYAAANQSVAATAWVTIGTEQVDNASQLTSAANHESRKGSVGATPQWGPAAANIQAVNGPFRSPNLAAIVQEIVDRGGWSSGNAIQFFAAPNPSTVVDYQFRAYYEGVAAAYPVFEVVWETGGAAQDITVTAGVASAEAIPSATVSRGPVSVSPTAVASGETLPSPVLTTQLTFSLTGIVSEEVFGSSTLAAGPVSLLANAISSAEAFGSHVLGVGTVTIDASGIAGTEAFGTHTFASFYQISPGSIGSQESFGSLSLNSLVVLLPTSIVSSEAFGGATLDLGPVSLLPVTISSAEGVGDHTVSIGGVVLLPSGVSPQEVFGTHQLLVGGVGVLPVSITSSEQFGGLVVELDPEEGTLAPTGIPSAETFGGATLFVGGVIIVPNGVASEEIFGSSTLFDVGVGPPPRGIFIVGRDHVRLGAT